MTQACPHVSGLADYYNNIERPMTSMEKGYYNIYLRKHGNVPLGWQRSVFEGILIEHFQDAPPTASPPPSTEYGSDTLADLMNLEQALHQRAKKMKATHGGLENKDAARLCASVLSK
ncbi:hypothetical protein TrLO_g14649, partial [Triparma laevis f. longispina]